MFKESLFAEYPVPRSYSIWGGDGIEINPIEDINALIENSVRELASDIYVIESKTANQHTIKLPDDTIAVSNAKLMMQFPGNRLVKVNFDYVTKRVSLRYFPAIITYRRKVRVEDLNSVLEGDMLLLVKSYILWKMAQKELQIISSLEITPSEIAVKADSLEKFVEEHKTTYLRLKEEILIYAVTS